MITIGIDPSINSTGVCINTGKTFKYIIVTGKLSKKQLSFQHKYIKFLDYGKQPLKNLEYSDREFLKSENIYNIISSLRFVLKPYKNKEVQVNMEGISYGSTGSAALADLSGLNFSIRMLLLEMGIRFTIIPPITLKIFATNNAGASKEEMIWAWKLLNPEISNISDIKIDDLADAYFLSRFISCDKVSQ